MSMTQDRRHVCAQRLEAAAARVPQLRAFIGLDGFVDDILHVVDTRKNAEEWTRLPRMEQWAERIRRAAGHSTNIELVSQMMKLGGNGPIMANALAAFGLRVTYLGLLGYPHLHEVFQEFSRRAEVHSIAEPGYTYAVEFEDGKVMLGKHQSLKEMNWANLRDRFGLDRLRQQLVATDFVGFVNWTMLPYMSEVWQHLQREICPQLNGPRRPLFVDLADPEKREDADLRAALELLGGFSRWFDVILGLNEKEAHEVARKALGIDRPAPTPEALSELAREIYQHLHVHTLVVHPVAYALAISPQGAAFTPGPVTATPKITTGAGDHFNSGFCLGRLLGLDDLDALLMGVTTSGYYVRTARSPGVPELLATLRDPAIAY